jgi:oligopeptide/dipeptide ABC transporter ATP-binding protein
MVDTWPVTCIMVTWCSLLTAGILLEFRNISVIFKIGGGIGLFGAKNIVAVKDISFALQDTPMITALVGESGSGKSTIARLAAGLLKPTYGEVKYRGKSIDEWIKAREKQFRKEVQIIFQDPYGIYNPYYKIDRFLYTALKKLANIGDVSSSKSLIIEAMYSLGMRPEEILGRYPHQLSGGERQRLMLVLALLIKPRLLIADEPVSMIDASLRAIFLENLLELKSKISTSCLYITHDLITANYVADEILVLCHGRLVESGPAEKVISDPLHPYTRLLVKSILLPDPKMRHVVGDVRIQAATLSELKPEKGCVFRYRCPYAMKVCEAAEPTLIKFKNGRHVACYLYESSSSLVQ